MCYYKGSCVNVPFAIVGFIVVAYVLLVVYSAVRSKKLREEQRQRDVHREEQRQRDVHKQFEDEFGKRKQAIGKIVCPQCKWTGNWGDGMSYQEFFAYELHVKYKVEIDETLIRYADNLSNESQYKCPLCKSTNWQKV